MPFVRRLVKKCAGQSDWTCLNKWIRWLLKLQFMNLILAHQKLSCCNIKPNYIKGMTQNKVPFDSQSEENAKQIQSPSLPLLIDSTSAASSTSSTTDGCCPILASCTASGTAQIWLNKFSLQNLKLCARVKRLRSDERRNKSDASFVECREGGEEGRDRRWRHFCNSTTVNIITYIHLTS